ncbi:MAG: hypothetical protein ABUM51_02855 [Bacteroidota bacterium]
MSLTDKLTGKRKKIVEMIAAMSAAMNFPAESLKSLKEDLDLSIATDEQVNMIYTGLVELEKKYNKKFRTNLFKRAKIAMN